MGKKKDIRNVILELVDERDWSLRLTQDYPTYSRRGIWVGRAEAYDYALDRLREILDR